MKREIIKIDEEKCNGCGLCIPACPEGALQIIDGKARLVSDLMCDGLGACLGECPEGAITIEEREAEPYNEKAVIKEIVKQGKNTVIAHLKHLVDHNEMGYFDDAAEYLDSVSESLPFSVEEVMDQVYQSGMVGSGCTSGHCPGSAIREFNIDPDEIEASGKRTTTVAVATEIKSELRQWPVQMHLINPAAPYFRNANVVLTADCAAFSVGNFHQKFLKGNSLAIACPKLDSGKEIYVEKLKAMIDESRIETLQVIIMEVPCCGGLLHIAELALQAASRKVPLKKTVISIQGEVLFEEWIHV